MIYPVVGVGTLNLTLATVTDSADTPASRYSIFLCTTVLRHFVTHMTSMALNGCIAAFLFTLFSVCVCCFSYFINVSFYPQGSESELVNGPDRDSGLASSHLEPSATLPSKGGAESEPETIEGMLCRKQEMESHSKKAASR